MAHVGQEFAFSAAGGFSGFLGPLPLEFGLFARGDIVADADDSGNVTIGLEDRTLVVSSQMGLPLSVTLCS